MNMRKAVALLMALLLLPGSAFAATLTADAAVTTHPMSDTLYGLFFEDINHGADGGLYAELLDNRSFEYQDILNPQPHQRLNGWQFNMTFGASGTAKAQQEAPLNENNPTYMHITCTEGAFRFANVGFQASTFKGGIMLDAGRVYDCSVYLRNAGDYEGHITVALTKRAGTPLSEVHTLTLTDTWQKYEMSFTATDTAEAVLSFVMEGQGSIDVDMASLIPADSFGREWPGGGLRRDLVEALQGLNPSFLRFPGGCIVEGSYYQSNVYDWKDTVGPVEQRRENFNTWGYMQSYGLGYFEYFCLAEALGAEPLPVVHAGLLCQAREKREPDMPLTEVKTYAQDLLDLIEFANGDVTTPWGALRAEMGHPEPFNMKYLGIGNENWDTQYWSRFEILYKAVKEAHPEITVISSAGPVAEGALPRSAWSTIRRRFPDTIVDEHYYMAPDWFLKNTTRYDSYPRTTKVFVGEYAAHENAASNGRRPNTLFSALCEAAYMTGLERNSDVVAMASYAPLMARDGMQQWTPNLIWFNARDVMLTPNYHIQAMFAKTVGDHVVESRCDSKITRFYHVVTRTEDKLYVKLVNVSSRDETLTLDLAGVPDGMGTYTRLTGDYKAVNTLHTRDKVAPVTGECPIADGTAEVVLPAFSATIYTFQLK